MIAAHWRMIVVRAKVIATGILIVNQACYAETITAGTSMIDLDLEEDSKAMMTAVIYQVEYYLF